MKEANPITRRRDRLAIETSARTRAKVEMLIGTWLPQAEEPNKKRTRYLMNIFEEKREQRIPLEEKS